MNRASFDTAHEAAAKVAELRARGFLPAPTGKRIFPGFFCASQETKRSPWVIRWREGGGTMLNRPREQRAARRVAYLEAFPRRTTLSLMKNQSGGRVR